ncbi:MAG: hypothetical protein Q4F57_00625 [Weeksellaceae bacterium]|nr:hypothetical protein [Weeksellaceae bacterium]
MEYGRNYTPEYNERFVSRVFDDRESAETAYRDLEERGYSREDINVMMSDKTRDTYFGEDSYKSDLGDKVAENAGKGSLIGGGIGAVVGAIAAIGSNVIFPGLGLVIAGPLAAGLAGAGAGAAAGGLIGALTGMGVPDDEAKYYKDRIKDGGIYMGFEPRGSEDARYMYDRWYTTDYTDDVENLAGHEDPRRGSENQDFFDENRRDDQRLAGDRTDAHLRHDDHTRLEGDRPSDSIREENV